MQWYFGVLKKYAVFRGRAGRKEFWCFELVNLLIFIGLVGVAIALARFQPSLEAPGPLVACSFAWMAVVLYPLVALVPGLAVAVRRLHDTDRSGWWLLLGLVPFAGAVVLTIFCAQSGQLGENRYGPADIGLEGRRKRIRGPISLLLVLVGGSALYGSIRSHTLLVVAVWAALWILWAWDRRRYARQIEAFVQKSPARRAERPARIS